MDASNPQVRIVLTELARRVGALVLFIVAAVLGFGYGRAELAFAVVILGILVYVIPPRPNPPLAAVHHERMPSVYVPDLLGFMLATLLFALPLVVAVQEPWRGGPWGLYLITGVPGLIVLVLFWVAIRHQCMWLRATGGELTFADLNRVTSVHFDAIAKVRGDVKPPPRWLKPLLTLFGGRRGLGTALVSDRASHALIVDLRDGSHLRLPGDAFPEMKQVLATLQHGGVELDDPLRALAGKAHRRRAADARKEDHARGHSRTS